ncbi:UbiA-like polyprenyltransferase [Hydrogenibacillus schlegelii]|nr:UbiA-like polyprenyltransferase [Hydrogenibacillus schlegelii]KWX07362.1 prenyltransferase [Hydrogenibacillus schlegelii]MBT9282378.1 putative 4-hydroxybenzoate polyprenyltransferase [Hydrogenibacillus schlegelii]OAR05627.1 4-hydroxybenzoate octaprenyltransferase [Hydrogenibacillus schlegelii]
MGKFRAFLEMIKFEHTIFALPFAYLGLIFGRVEAYGGWPDLWLWFWTTMAMVGARTAAMALNRLIDRAIDALNPRTKDRPLVTGKVTVREAWGYTLLSLALLFVSAAMLNPLAVKLLPIAVFFLVFYSYTKRFTWLSHLVLGVTDGLAPLGGWVAATGRLDHPAAWWLFLAVVFWIAGFDILYATQDLEFDRRHGLHSIPVRFGLRRALGIARGFHALTVAFLAATGLALGLGGVFGLGVVVAAGILAYEHALVSPTDLSRLNTAFFTMNGVLAVVVFVFALVAVGVGR